MTLILIVDDIRILEPQIPWATVIHHRHWRPALDHLAAMGSNGVVDQLWLDHDLGWDGETFADTKPLLYALEEDVVTGTNLYPEIQVGIVHSANPTFFKHAKWSLEKICTHGYMQVDANDYLVGLVDERPQIV